MTQRRYLQEQGHSRPDSRQRWGRDSAKTGWSRPTRDMFKATSMSMISLQIRGWGKLDGFKPFVIWASIGYKMCFLLGAEGFCRMVLNYLVPSLTHSITTKKPGGTHWICSWILGPYVELFDIGCTGLPWQETQSWACCFTRIRNCQQHMRYTPTVLQ